MDCSTPGLPVHHQLPELAQTHVHWVGDAIQPPNPLCISFSFGNSNIEKPCNVFQLLHIDTKGPPWLSLIILSPSVPLHIPTTPLNVVSTPYLFHPFPAHVLFRLLFFVSWTPSPLCLHLQVLPSLKDSVQTVQDPKSLLSCFYLYVTFLVSEPPFPNVLHLS